MRQRQSVSVAIPEIGRSERQRFWAKVERRCPDECWPWTGAGCTGGYGRFKLAGRLYSPHRIAYTLAHGKIPSHPSHHGLVVMHSCDNPACCNPAHLSLGTAQDNARDMTDKGRGWFSRERPPTKLGPDASETVKAICEHPGSSREIAPLFGLSHSHVRAIRRQARRSTP